MDVTSMTPTITSNPLRRIFCFAVPYGGADDFPVPLLMSEPSAPCGVVRPLWVYPDSDEYLLFHVDEEVLEQMIAFVHTETRIDSLGRKLAPYHDSIQHFLRDAKLRMAHAAVTDALYKNPELLPAIASIFAARETLLHKQTAGRDGI